MPSTIAYLRKSTDKQDLQSQKLSILEYCQNHDIKVSEWIEVSGSSQKSQKQRKLDTLFGMIQPGDTVIVSELSRLARSISEMLRLIDEHFIRGRVNLISIKENIRILDGKKPDIQSKIMITLISLFAEIERELISQRTLAGLQRARESGNIGGRPKGSQSILPLDEYREKIIYLRDLGVPVSRIAETLDINASTLRYYIRTRNL